MQVIATESEGGYAGETQRIIGQVQTPVADPIQVLTSQSSPVQNTWYDVVDLSLAGLFLGAEVQRDSTGQDVQLRVTIDGGTPQTFSNSQQVMQNRMTNTTTTSNLFVRANVKFATSLLVEMRTTIASVSNLHGLAHYMDDQ